MRQLSPKTVTRERDRIYREQAELDRQDAIVRSRCSHAKSMHYRGDPSGNNDWCMEINHKDANNQNNRRDNLEYVTPKENLDHYQRAIRLGIAARPNHAKKLTISDVKEIIRLSHDLSQNAIAAMFGVDRATVYDIIRRRTWVCR